MPGCCNYVHSCQCNPASDKGNSSVPVGDCVQNVNPGWHVALSGASWDRGAGAGVFSLSLDSWAGSRYRSISGRSVYIPSRKKELDDAA